MSAVELKLYDILKGKLGEAEAKVFFDYIEAKTEAKYEQKKDTLLTKDDKIDIMRTIYYVGFGQFVAIIISVLAIIKFVG